MRLIDADNIIHALEAFADIEHGNHHFMYGIESAKEIVTESETIDAVPVVRGELKICDDGFLRCTSCNYPLRLPLVSIKEVNFCWYCGAKLRGPWNDEKRNP